MRNELHADDEWQHVQSNFLGANNSEIFLCHCNLTSVFGLVTDRQTMFRTLVFNKMLCGVFKNLFRHKHSKYFQENLLIGKLNVLE